MLAWGYLALLAFALPSQAPGVVSSLGSEVACLMDHVVPVRSLGDRATFTGVRATQGNAVDCPQIRDDAGQLHSVSHLSAAIAIGGRVSVSGFYAITTKCVGTVLVVESETDLGK